MKIYSLKEKPEHLIQLARWHHAEWSHLSPDRCLEDRVEYMRAQLGDTPLPTTFLAEQDGQLLGSASLVVEDMDSHPELTPWLASVYVTPRHRNKGIASQLVNRVIDHARECGVSRMYLFTPDRERLYAQLGWKLFAREHYHGVPVSLMTFDLV